MYSKRVISLLLSYSHQRCKLSGSQLARPSCRRYSTPAAALPLKRDEPSPMELIAAQLDGTSIMPMSPVPTAISSIEEDFAALYPYLAETLPPLWDLEMIENTRKPEEVTAPEEVVEKRITEDEKFHESIVAEVAAILKESTFENAFNTWLIRSQDDRTIAGAGLLMDAALKGPVLVQPRMVRILNAIIKIKSPDDGYAECVMALIRRGDFEDAKVLMTVFVIQPRKFKYLIKDFTNSDDLNGLELFANLVSETYLYDRRAAKRNAAPEEKAPENVIPTFRPTFNYGNVKYLVDVTVKPRVHKIGYRPKAPKVKKYELNAHQMDIMANILINNWISLAQKREDTEALRRLYAWMIEHHYELSNRQTRNLESYFRKASTPNFFSRLSADLELVHAAS